MPVRDMYHKQMKSALIKDGWTITHDPFTIALGLRNVFVDFGAERMLAAEKDNQKIAVKVKNFQGTSDMRDVQQAVGQYVFYRSLLSRILNERSIWQSPTLYWSAFWMSRLSGQSWRTKKLRFWVLM